MSENIQSISQGTYTIGQTSATNFVAGPGIRIDEPSAGTVRIGNDETVLWSGTMWDGQTISANLSEPASSFGYVRLEGYVQEANYRKCIQLFPTELTGTFFANFGNIMYNDLLHYNDSTDVLALQSHSHWWFQGSSVSTGTNGLVVTKVIGINRKEV